MSKGFYWKLAASNIKNNRKTYIPYMLTCILTIAMFYMILSLSENSGLEELMGSTTVVVTLRLGCIVTGIFATIFLFYTNSFLIKRRKKEFGLFNILGMEKRHLGRVIACETLCMLALSLAVGLGVGMLTDKLMFLILINLFNGEIPLGFDIKISVIVPTVLFFCGIFLLIFLNSFRQIHLAKPIELLHGGELGEREPKTRWLLALIGFVCLGSGYYIAVTTTDPLQAILLFFVAVILVIIGTYCLFTAGSVAILKLLRKNKGYYYKTKHFISVSGMIYRMKQNAVGLANICILSTMVLVMVSATMSMYLGGKELMEHRYPREIIINEINGQPDMIQEVGGVLEEMGLTPQDSFDYRYLEYTVYQNENAFVTSLPDSVHMAQICTIMVLSLEDYNRISNQSYTLENSDEILIFSSSSEFRWDSLELAGKEYHIRGRLDAFPYNGTMYANMVDSYVLVVQDMNILNQMYENQLEVYQEDASEVRLYYGFNLDAENDTKISVFQNIRQTLSSRKFSGSIENRTEGETEFMGMFGGFFFIGIFLGLLFIMATILIIYYKQISEGYDDRTRFEIMQKVGMTRGEIKKSIHSQVLTVFFLPLVTAGVHVAFAFPFISRILRVLAMQNDTLFALCTLGCFLVFAVFYAVVYSLTARVYYRIVS